MKRVALITSLAFAACGEATVLNGAEATFGDCLVLSQERFEELAAQTGQTPLIAELGATGMKVEGGASSTVDISGMKSGSIMTTVLPAPPGSLAKITSKGKTRYLQAASDTKLILGRPGYACNADGTL